MVKRSKVKIPNSVLRYLRCFDRIIACESDLYSNGSRSKATTVNFQMVSVINVTNSVKTFLTPTISGNQISNSIVDDSREIKISISQLSPVLL